MKRFVIQLLAASLFFLASCQKDSDVFVPDAGQQLDSAWVGTITSNMQVSTLTSKIAGIFEIAQANTTSDTAVRNNTGLLIEIPRGALLSAGTEFTGAYRVEYMLLQKKGDFIRYGVPTSSNRFPLESGGALMLRMFTSTGAAITVNPAKRIYIRYGVDSTRQNMSLYYSSLTPTASLAFNWLPANDGSIVNTWATNTPPAKGYVISTARTGWLSVDRLFDNSLATTEVGVVLPNLFSNANTAVYMVFKNIRSVVQLSGNPATRIFSFPNIPVNSDVKFVAISKVGDNYYLGVKDDRVITNFSTFIKPEISSLDKINSLLNSL
jgi:hypothetical protein